MRAAPSGRFLIASTVGRNARVFDRCSGVHGVVLIGCNASDVRKGAHAVHRVEYRLVEHSVSASRLVCIPHQSTALLVLPFSCPRSFPLPFIDFPRKTLNLPDPAVATSLPGCVRNHGIHLKMHKSYCTAAGVWQPSLGLVCPTSC